MNSNKFTEFDTKK